MPTISEFLGKREGEASCCTDCGRVCQPQDVVLARMHAGECAERICNRCAPGRGYGQCTECRRWCPAERIAPAAGQNRNLCTDCAEEKSLQLCDECLEWFPATACTVVSGSTYCRLCSPAVLRGMPDIYRTGWTDGYNRVALDLEMEQMAHRDTRQRLRSAERREHAHLFMIAVFTVMSIFAYAAPVLIGIGKAVGALVELLMP